MSAKEDWCWSTDEENYTLAESRDEALREAFLAAQKTPEKRAWLGRVRWYTHSDFVSGLGNLVRERLTECAWEKVSDHAEAYPEGPVHMERDIERLILTYLEENSPQPRFFTAYDVACISVAPEVDEKKPEPGSFQLGPATLEGIDFKPTGGAWTATWWIPITRGGYESDIERMAARCVRRDDSSKAATYALTAEQPPADCAHDAVIAAAVCGVAKDPGKSREKLTVQFRILSTGRSVYQDYVMERPGGFLSLAAQLEEERLRQLLNAADVSYSASAYTRYFHFNADHLIGTPVRITLLQEPDSGAGTLVYSGVQRVAPRVTS